MNRNQLQRAVPRGVAPQRPTAPVGAPMGGFAGYPQVPQGYPQGMPQGFPPGFMPQPQGMPQGMVPYIPQGADQGALAGCGNPGYPGMPYGNGCGTGPALPFAGFPNILNANCFVQPNTLLGITVTPTSAGSTTLEISCGSSIFYGYCARSFNAPLTYGLTSIISSGDYNRLCSDGGMVDVAYFDTTDCCCPFDFGCFNNTQPLFITFQPITATSVLVPFSLVIGGCKLLNFGCPPFPCYPPYGPQPMPGSSGVPGLPPSSVP